MTLIVFFKMADDPYFFLNGSRPQVFFNMEEVLNFCVQDGRQPCLFNIVLNA